MIKWYEKTLDELGIVARGKSKHRPRDAEFLYGGPYPFIQTADVKNANLYINSFSQTYSEEGLKQSKLWPVGTLCITIAANIADTAILDIEACFPDSIIGFIANEDICNVKFIKYYLSYFQNSLKQISQGAAQDNLNLKKLLNFKFKIPNKNTQDKMAYILSSYDDLIENNFKRIQLLEESAELIYKEWFVNFRFPGYEKCEFVDGVPVGWSRVHLNEIVSTQYGFTESALNEDTGVKYLRGKDINKTSYINWSSVPWCKIEDNQKDKYALKKHDILVIRMADPGKVGIVEEDIEAVFASYLIRVNINNDNIKPYYLFYFLNSDFYQQFISQSSTGATRKSANAKLITDVDILMPEKKVIEQFETKITDLRVLLNNLLQQNQKLKEARDILIPKLIMGEIEV
ncbi:restriction endonuclease subunit S [Clostridium sporogenes]|uniref:restriction endonuclease subunit S n=1 Tax=Clostridium sporogenes TaxID=1509 RepID=UPI001C0F50FF|nr:restriction endonuclease subunit S [Clostridium sporogenes]MBU5300470.1 restriction endonuclease subunit S [Clostridium sporogenes]